MWASVNFSGVCQPQGARGAHPGLPEAPPGQQLGVTLIREQDTQHGLPGASSLLPASKHLHRAFPALSALPRAAAGAPVGSVRRIHRADVRPGAPVGSVRRTHRADVRPGTISVYKAKCTSDPHKPAIFTAERSEVRSSLGLPRSRHLINTGAQSRQTRGRHTDRSFACRTEQMRGRPPWRGWPALGRGPQDLTT